MRIKILLVLLVLSTTSAWAVTYKCDVNGQVVYGDKPCEKGESRQIAVKDALEPQPEKQVSSEERVKGEKQQAEALRKARLKREKAEEKARQKAWQRAQKDEKRRKAHCKALAKALAKPPSKRQAKRQDAAKREEYERECRDAGGMN